MNGILKRRKREGGKGEEKEWTQSNEKREVEEKETWPGKEGGRKKEDKQPEGMRRISKELIKEEKEKEWPGKEEESPEEEAIKEGSEWGWRERRGGRKKGGEGEVKSLEEDKVV